jgi:hypothetical protein
MRASAEHDRLIGGLIIRQSVPRNLEAPFDQVDSYLTPRSV